jgi:hypothetical protein
MTYQELLNFLQTISPSKLNQTVTIHNLNEDELYPLDEIVTTSEETEDRLDDGHIVLRYI